MTKAGWVCAAVLAMLAALPARAVDVSIPGLLARRCLGCHNDSDRKGGLDLTRSEAALKGGDSGPALVPGKPLESLLWERVSQDEMPPKQPLSNAEKESLRQWLAAGAKWEPDPIDRFAFTTDSRAGYDWWSLQPVRRHDPPPVGRRDWPVNPIDHFVLAKLEASGLGPSPQADKRTLIRRLAFDLTGLPPRPEEVEAFLVDASPAAYQKLVDRLLDSAHYGERWGRHWLDVVRYGESQGFERDKLRANAWQYRDWVIAAFNGDLPYDEFLRLQVAGDVFEPHNPRAVIATGFLVCAPWDEVGQSQQSAPMRAVVRQDELEDIVGVTSQTFLGLTVHCARCHDHKFDPIRQREYYGISALLAGVRHGERETLSEIGRVRQSRRVAELQSRIDELSRQRERLDAGIRDRLMAKKARSLAKSDSPLAWLDHLRRFLARPLPIARWEFDGDLKDSVGGLHGTADGEARVVGGRLMLDGKSYVATEPLPRELRAKTLEVWVTLSKHDQQAGGAMSVERPDGSAFDAIVYGEKDQGQWMAGSDFFKRTSSFQGPPEQETPTSPVQIVIAYGEDKSIAAYRNGRPYGKPYVAASLETFPAGSSRVLFGLRHSPPGGNKHLAATIERAAIYDRALTAEEVARLAEVEDLSVSNEELLAELNGPDREEWVRLDFERSRLHTELRLLSGGAAYAVNPKHPETTHILARGDPGLKGEVATPGGIASVQGPPAFQLEESADDAARRLKLAEWMADPRNPLTPRVIANRLWHYHFGQGLVDTPNDFGFNGGRPSHPELLDWLADELVRPRLPVAGTVEEQTPPAAWSLKHLHRLIVSSAAYRQDSRSRADAERIDAGNRLLWRRSPQRLEAESVRDAMLLVTGELNPEMGGPGFKDFRTFTFNSQFYEMLDPLGREFQRRTVYRTWVRSGRSEFLDVFDCPDPSATAPRRAVTTTPLQALSLLNNSFVLRMSNRLADRAAREAPEAIDTQVSRVYALAYSRSPSTEEAALGREFVATHGLAAYCRVIFNSNECLYVD